ncbi:MAG TPA: FixH family protein [Polyangiaceae bacterium]|nr:FixH family protein [Polyangiaceae bacterium]
MRFGRYTFNELWLGLALLGGVACSSGAVEPPPTVVASESGALRVELSSPDGIARGLNRFQFEVLEAADESPATELEFRMQPFMPAMGHGSGGEPEVRSIEAGRYEFSSVLLNMAGRWQLRTTISGARSDYVVFDVDVP